MREKGRQYRYRGSGYLWCANERLALAVKVLHRHVKTLYVQRSDRPVSLRVNQRCGVAGQPRARKARVFGKTCVSIFSRGKPIRNRQGKKGPSTAVQAVEKEGD